MELFSTLAAIVVLTVAARIAQPYLPVAVCPLCAGVSGAWLLILGGSAAGFLAGGAWPFIAAIMMGGSVVGIMYTLERRMPDKHFPLAPKTVFVAAGFAAVYAFVRSEWMLAAAAAVVAVAAISFPAVRRRGRTDEAAVQRIEREMEHCC